MLHFCKVIPFEDAQSCFGGKCRIAEIGEYPFEVFRRDNFCGGAFKVFHLLIDFFAEFKVQVYNIFFLAFGIPISSCGLILLKRRQSVRRVILAAVQVSQIFSRVFLAQACGPLIVSNGFFPVRLYQSPHVVHHTSVDDTLQISLPYIFFVQAYELFAFFRCELVIFQHKVYHGVIERIAGFAPQFIRFAYVFVSLPEDFL